MLKNAQVLWYDDNQWRTGPPEVRVEFLSMDVERGRVVLTPHLGSAVGELRERMAHIVVDNILAVIRGERPPNLYNPEVYEGGG